MLPFEGETLEVDPFTDVQRNNAALLGEVRAGDPGAPGASPPSQGFPPGLAPQQDHAAEGLPAHLSGHGGPPPPEQPGVEYDLSLSAAAPPKPTVPTPHVLEALLESDLALALTAQQLTDLQLADNAGQRQEWAKKGLARSDGSWPIPDVSYLKKACQAFPGRAKGQEGAIKSWIMKRAKALGALQIPELDRVKSFSLNAGQAAGNADPDLGGPDAAGNAPVSEYGEDDDASAATDTDEDKWTDIDAKLCPQCQTYNQTDARYCVGCGYSLAGAPTEKMLQGSRIGQVKPAPPSQVPDPEPESFDDDSLDITRLAQDMKLKCPKCDHVNKASDKNCSNCGHSLADARKAKFANMSQPHQLVIFQQQDGMHLSAAAEDGLIYKVVCSTGTLALSPGPGQVDVEKPLNLTSEMFDHLKKAYDEKAFPYVTVPQTHANGVLENTGYVRKLSVHSHDDPTLPERIREAYKDAQPGTKLLLAGIEFTEPEVKAKAERGSIADTSVGVKFNYRNKRSGKLYPAALEHVALTNVPWVDGLVPFGEGAILSQQGGIYDADEIDYRYDGVFIDAPEVALAGNPFANKGDDAGKKTDPDDSPTQTKECTNCHTANKADAQKCSSCGKPMIGVKAKTLPEGKKLGDKLNASQDGDPAAGDTLPEEHESGTLPGMTPPTTVEELLAAQQVEAERQAARIQQLEQELALSQGTISTMGEQLHAEGVNQRIGGLQKAGLPAGVLLAAKEVYLADKAAITPGAGEGLNLSVAVQERDETSGELKLSTKTLKTASDVVDHLLAKMPTGENPAALLASINSGLDASMRERHDDAQDPAKQVDAWERENHPERFEDSGKGKRIA